MKAESTIRKQINRIRFVCENTDDECLSGEAYEAYHALRWVLENTTWTPAGMMEERMEKSEREKNNG